MPGKTRPSEGWAWPKPDLANSNNSTCTISARVIVVFVCKRDTTFKIQSSSPSARTSFSYPIPRSRSQLPPASHQTAEWTVSFESSHRISWRDDKASQSKSAEPIEEMGSNSLPCRPKYAPSVPSPCGPSPPRTAIRMICEHQVRGASLRFRTFDFAWDNQSGLGQL